MNLNFTGDDTELFEKIFRVSLIKYMFEMSINHRIRLIGVVIPPNLQDLETTLNELFSWIYKTISLTAKSNKHLWTSPFVVILQAYFQSMILIEIYSINKLH